MVLDRKQRNAESPRRPFLKMDLRLPQSGTTSTSPALASGKMARRRHGSSAARDHTRFERNKGVAAAGVRCEQDDRLD